MLEEKKYNWLLTELSKIKAKLKIIEIAFIKGDGIESWFTTNADGIITSNAVKNLLVRDVLKRYLLKRSNGRESQESIKPIALAFYSLSKKVLFLNETQEIIRKDVKLHNLRELLAFQDYNHDYFTYYTLELAFDGEGLVSFLTRKDVNNPEIMSKDSKYLHLTINLSKYLVKIIENALNKNVIRLKYDFVIDPGFNLLILSVSTIKIAHPKIIGLNKGLNAEQLENLTLVKGEFKNVPFHRIPMLVKEPEPDSHITEATTKSSTTSIFVSVVAKFLSGSNKKPLRKKTFKSSQTLSQQLSPVPMSSPEMKKSDPEFFTEDNVSNDAPALNSVSPALDLLDKKKMKTKNFHIASTPRLHAKRSLFPNLLPNSSLSNFLRLEEERILESQSRNLKNSIASPETLPTLPALKKKKKLRKKSKKEKTKKASSARKFVSPYRIFP